MRHAAQQGAGCVVLRQEIFLAGDTEMPIDLLHFDQQSVGEA